MECRVKSHLACVAFFDDSQLGGMFTFSFPAAPGSSSICCIGHTAEQSHGTLFGSAFLHEFDIHFCMTSLPRPAVIQTLFVAYIDTLFWSVRWRNAYALYVHHSYINLGFFFFFLVVIFLMN